MRNAPCTVVVLDDHDLTRLALSALLRRAPWVARCEPVRELAEAVRLTDALRPRVVVVDASAAGALVEHHCAALRHAHGAVRIVLTARCPQTTTDAVVRRAGAVASLGPQARAAEILAAVRAAAHETAGRPEPVASGPPPERLSVREQEVARLLATGATNREIARQLRLGPDAIKKHSSAIYRKLGVRNRTEAAALLGG